MALGSRGDFFGGYDHAKQAGVVHIADHHIAPGKKQWTWGNHEFGYAWDRNLTDADGPYIELMAGVYTDNQPDFSFLMPGETKSFRQYWYPIREIGPAQNANRDAAVSLHIANGQARVGVAVSGIFEQSTVIFETTETRIEWSCDLQPGKPFVVECAAPGFEPRLRVLDWNQRETISYAPVAEQKTVPPRAATEPALPSEIESSDELYLTGLHLAQYRHTTRLPEFYWQEALRRDQADARSNNALGLWHLRRGEFKAAEQHFRAAIARLTERNPNPYDGEPFYNLGLALRYLGRQGEAYDAFYKAAWNQPWRAAAHHALAEIDAARENWPHALEHLEQGLALNSGNLQTRNLLVLVLRKAGQTDKAERMLQETLALDPLDIWANDLAGRSFAADNQMRMDLAIDYLHAGLLCEARCVLAAADFTACDGSVPMLYYALGYLSADDDARAFYRQAAEALPDYCFPARLEEMLFLEAALAANPADAHAHLYLGNLLYDKRRHQEAIEHWRAAADLDGTLATAWRNLGIAAYNIERNVEQAREYYERAIAAGAADARVYYERDQLHKRAGVNARARLAEMERRPDLVAQRDDATVELAALYNQTGAPEKAAAVLASRKFQPWEGGEGAALGQHVRTQLALGRRALSAERWDEARDRFQAALESPANLGEAKHLLANQSNIYFWLGTAHAAQGQAGAAQACWQRASRYLGDFQEMSVKPYSEMTLYSALALRKLGRTAEADGLLKGLLSYAEGLLAIEAKIDYFATSLPSMLLFEEDLAEKNRIVSQLLQAQAALGLGDTESATAILRQVLADDPNHAAAHDLQEELPLLSRESTCIRR
jgi:tetratricopeptide (TPR) repeat protein